MVSAATVAATLLALPVFPLMEPTLRDGLDNRNPRQLRRFALRESPCLLAPPSIRIGPRRARSGQPSGVTYCRVCYQPSASWRKAITLGHESLQAVDCIRSARKSLMSHS